jgi:hypothetical protein
MRRALTRFNSAAFETPSFYAGYQPVNLGIPGPRTSVIGELEANCPRIWPTPYAWRAMGLYAASLADILNAANKLPVARTWPRFQLGVTAPIFDNQFAGYAPGFNVMMPGLSRTPFGG